MQYHSGAYILALQNLLNGNVRDEYKVRLSFPKSNHYRVRIISDNGSQIKMSVSASPSIWSCYCTANISGRSERLHSIQLKHEEKDSDRPTDEFKMDSKEISNGNYTPMRGNNRRFSGSFCGLNQLQIYTINKQGKSVRCDFELL